jgi:RHH-type rel operon transcriptional repressor/antitoxin RelB
MKHEALGEHGLKCYTRIARNERMLAIRLPPDIERRLDALAASTGRTKTFYAREAILKYLDDLEDIYLAERTLEEIRAGKVKTTPLADVMREYGLED